MHRNIKIWTASSQFPHIGYKEEQFLEKKSSIPMHIMLEPRT